MNRLYDIVRRQFTRALALSERTIRSLAAVVGGTSTLVTDTLFPEALRGTTTYQVTVGMLQRYIIEQVAGMAGPELENQVEMDDYVRRKMAGTALEAAGLLAMGFSPLWVFAIAGDAVKGSKVYLNRLVTQLKEDGMVAEEAEVDDLVDLLEAIQNATSKSAVATDMPPLTRKDLAALANDLRTSYGRVFGGTVDLIPRFDGIWVGMVRLANRENISLKRLGGLMTVDAVTWSKKRVRMVGSAGKTGTALFDEKILDSYRKTLTAATEEGVDKYITGHMQPFLRAAKAHFDAEQRTWIEGKLGGSGADLEKG